MKKALLIASMLILLLLCSFSVSAFEDSMTNTYLISTTNGYTFESVVTPTVTAQCMPVIAMYDGDGILCGLKYGDETLSLTAGKSVVKTFTVENCTSAPSSIKLMLWKTGGSFAPLCRFEQVSTSLYSEKYGMIVEAQSGTGVKLFTSDASSAVTYSLADSFILSHGNTVISDSSSVYNYLNSLRLLSYKRFAEIDTDGDGKSDSKPAYYDWMISFGDGALSSTDIRYKSTTATNTYLYNYNDFLNNYAARMVRVLVSGDKIGSMSFAGDSLLNKLTAGKSYAEVFYTSSTKSFNDSLNLADNAKILYFPARAGATESQFKVYTPATLKNGNLYYLKDFTTVSGEQIILVTHMLTDAEVTTYNEKPVANISIALYGVDDLPGILSEDADLTIFIKDVDADIQDEINDLICEAITVYVASGLKGALEGAAEGYAITKHFVITKLKTDVEAAHNLMQQVEKLSAEYYTPFVNMMESIIGVDAALYLKDNFL